MSAPVVRFARVDTDSTADATDTRLAAWELRRRDRLRHAADRDAFVAAHLLARSCLTELTGEQLDLSACCPHCDGSDHGRPFVSGRPELHVSLSHTTGWVAAIAATAPCGIDVQIITDVPDSALTPRERARARSDLQRSRLWARKEAIVKAGLAHIDDIGRLDVSVREPRLHDWCDMGVVGAWFVGSED